MGDSVEKKDVSDIAALNENTAASVHAGSMKDKSRFDVAASYLDQFASAHGNYSESEARKVLRKIDLRITPLLWITTILAAVDVGCDTHYS